MGALCGHLHPRTAQAGAQHLCFTGADLVCPSEPLVRSAPCFPHNTASHVESKSPEGTSPFCPSRLSPDTSSDEDFLGTESWGSHPDAQPGQPQALPLVLLSSRGCPPVAMLDLGGAAYRAQVAGSQTLPSAGCGPPACPLGLTFPSVKRGQSCPCLRVCCKGSGLTASLAFRAQHRTLSERLARIVAVHPDEPTAKRTTFSFLHQRSNSDFFIPS